MKKLLLFFLGVIVVFLHNSCGPTRTKIVSHPAGYDLDMPKLINLPVVLNEISGLAYYAKDSSLFAIQDEEGYLYKLFPYKRDSMFRWKYAGPGDFEDLLILNQSCYILRSDGDLYHCTIGDSVNTVIYHLPEQGNEFESIYYDSVLQLLKIVCKDCKADAKKTLSTFSFNLKANQFVSDSFKIDTREVARIQNQEKIKFKPSAAAIHPLSGKLYLISAVNSLLVIANRDGTIDNAYTLNKKTYKQPEGIAFAPDGTMFISNEVAGKGVANILMIPYQPKFK